MSDISAEQMVAGLESLGENIYFGRTVTIPEFECLTLAVDQLKPKRVVNTTSTVRCPGCGKQITNRGAIHPEINYCWKCGQAVKWE